MDELLNEHEQGERVRSWLQRNALGLIGGIAFGLAAVMGWQWWKEKQAAAEMAVAARYDAYSRSLAANPGKGQVELGRFPADSIYASLGRLQLAKTQVDAGKNVDALATLRAIQTRDAGLKRVVDQRIAALLIDTGKPADAIQLLAAASDAASLETLADAQAKLGKPQDAKANYARALRLLETGSPQRQVVEIKLAEVGGSVPSA